MKNTHTKTIKKFNITPYLMILPTFILLALFCFYPIYIAISKSFYNWSGGFGTGKNEFIGLNNYIYIFSDSLFLTSWLNVLFFAACGVAINLVFPILYAILVSRFTDKQSFIIRIVAVIPMVVPSVVIFLLYKNIYNPDYGLLTMLARLFDSEAIVDLLGSPITAKWAFVFMGFPWTGGTIFLIYYAGINNIPGEVLEAAQLDGASVPRLIASIYYPLLKPQMKLITSLQIINSIQGFVNIQTITDGGPGESTYVPGLYVYNAAFGGLPRYGRAAAGSIIMSIVVCILVILNNYVFSKEDNDAKA